MDGGQVLPMHSFGSIPCTQSLRVDSAFTFSIDVFNDGHLLNSRPCILRCDGIVCVLLRIFWTLRVPPTNAPTVQGPFGWPIFWVLFLPPQFEIPSAATPTCRTCGTTRARALHPTRKPDAEPNEIHLRDGRCGQWTGQRNHC